MQSKLQKPVGPFSWGKKLEVAVNIAKDSFDEHFEFYSIRELVNDGDVFDREISQEMGGHD